jgi:hypothetical protein
MNERRCHYETHPDQLASIRARTPIDPPAEECSGPIEWRNGTIWYCASHGYWHHGFNPFGGYERVES